MLYKITRKGKLCIIYIQKYYPWIPSVFEPQKPKYIQLLVSVSWKETRGWFTNGSLLCIFAIEIIIFYIWLYMLQETFNGCQHFLVIIIEKSMQGRIQSRDMIRSSAYWQVSGPLLTMVQIMALKVVKRVESTFVLTVV